MMTACAPPSCAQQVSFSLAEANRILDSLQARGDWQRMFVLQTARLSNLNKTMTHMEALDSLSRSQLAMCDSVQRKGHSERMALLQDKAKLERKVRRMPTLLTIAFTVGIFVTLLLQ